MTIIVKKIEGDYAEGMANEEHGGGMWFAANVSGQWKLVWDGNGMIGCAALAPYPKLPTDMVTQCFDEKTQEMKPR
jgi:hypothetical protein